MFFILCRILLQKYYASSWQGVRTLPTPLVCLRHCLQLGQELRASIWKLGKLVIRNQHTKRYKIGPKLRCEYLLPFSRYWRLNPENCLFFPPLPCLTLPLEGNPLEFPDEIYPAKTRRMVLPYDKNFIFLTSTAFVWYTRVTDGRTDGRAIAYSALCIYAVAR